MVLLLVFSEDFKWSKMAQNPRGQKSRIFCRKPTLKNHPHSANFRTLYIGPVLKPLAVDRSDPRVQILYNYWQKTPIFCDFGQNPENGQIRTIFDLFRE